MIISSLRLENIRSYINESIDFPDGSVLLSGDIGSGKSSILLAIEFALFGIMRSGLSGSSLLRHGCSQGSVELKFEIEKNEYLVKRTLKRARNTISQETGYIIENGRKFEGTPIELKARILEILGYPQELLTRSKSLIYRYTVYTAQEEMKQILFEEKDMRLDTLRKLFGIDKYKTIRENSVLFIRELKRKISDLSIRLENFEEHENLKIKYKERMKQLTFDIMEKNESLKAVKNNLEKEQESIEKIEEELKEYRELKKDFELKEMTMSSKKKEKEKLAEKIKSSNIQDLKKKLEEYSKINELKDEKILEQKLEKAQDKHSDIIKTKSRLKENLFHVENNIKLYEEQIEQDTKLSKESIILQNNLEELKQKILQKKKQQEILNDFIKKDKEYSIEIEKKTMIMQEAKEIITSIKESDICPKCRQEINEEHKQKVIKEEKKTIEKKQEEIEKLKKIISAIESNIKKIKNNIAKIEEFEKKYSETKEKLIKIESVSSKLVEKQKKLSQFYKEKKELKEKLDEPEEVSYLEKIQDIKKQLSEARDNNLMFREKRNIQKIIETEKKNIEIHNKDIETLEKEIKQIILDIENIRDKLNRYSQIEKKFVDKKDMMKDLLEKEKQIELKLAALNQENTSLEKSLKEINEKIEKLEKTKQKINSLNEIKDWFDSFFVKLMSTMEKHIMISIHREFNSLLKEWFSILIEDIDISLDDEFSVNLIQDGYETDVDSLSGGEKTSAALAYRLALNKVVNELIPSIKTKDLIILDEPTDGFSSEQLDKVKDVIEQLNMKQTIIVSHEPKMESYVENIIKIVKNEGISRVV
jgi:DNA repair protein SbcC/Rad50